MKSRCLHSWQWFAAWLLVLPAVLVQAQVPTVVKSEAVAVSQVVKSESDEREYRYLRLPNQLQVLLISDPAADKAAA